MSKKHKIRSCVTRHIAVLEDVPFILKDGEKVLSASYDAPYVYLILIKEMLPDVTFSNEPFFNGHPVEEGESNA